MQQEGRTRNEGVVSVVAEEQTEVPAPNVLGEEFNAMRLKAMLHKFMVPAASKVMNNSAGKRAWIDYWEQMFAYTENNTLPLPEPPQTRKEPK